MYLRVGNSWECYEIPDVMVLDKCTARAGSLSVATQFARRSRAPVRHERVATERRVVAVTVAATRSTHAIKGRISASEVESTTARATKRMI